MNENLHIQREMDDKPGEECGVFGIYDFDGNDIAQTIIRDMLKICIQEPTRNIIMPQSIL
mgnify:CR=1 FL=1